jgi:hypothetical protein
MKALKEIAHHLFSWAEGYLWLPLFIFGLIASKWLIVYETGRPLQYNIDWLMDLDQISIKCALIILFTSFFKQATGTGTWATREERAAHPGLALWSDVKVLLSFAGFLYVFTR